MEDEEDDGSTRLPIYQRSELEVVFKFSISRDGKGPTGGRGEVNRYPAEALFLKSIGTRPVEDYPIAALTVEADDPRKSLPDLFFESLEVRPEFSRG